MKINGLDALLLVLVFIGMLSGLGLMTIGGDVASQGGAVGAVFWAAFGIGLFAGISFYARNHAGGDH